jgi:hypothetical protein
MKQGCQGVSVAMPSEMAIALSRLPPYNRTTHINRAAATYLEVQGPAKNRHGVDCDYFRRKLAMLARDLGDYTPQELAECLKRLYFVAVDPLVDRDRVQAGEVMHVQV